MAVSIMAAFEKKNLYFRTKNILSMLPGGKIDCRKIPTQRNHSKAIEYHKEGRVMANSHQRASLTILLFILYFSLGVVILVKLLFILRRIFCIFVLK